MLLFAGMLLYFSKIPSVSRETLDWTCYPTELMLYRIAEDDVDKGFVQHQCAIPWIENYSDRKSVV